MARDVRCPSDSYRLDLNAGVRSCGDDIYGSWNEPNNAQGELAGRVSFGSFAGVVTSPAFSGTLRLRREETVND